MTVLQMQLTAVVEAMAGVMQDKESTNVSVKTTTMDNTVSQVSILATNRQLGSILRGELRMCQNAPRTDDWGNNVWRFGRTLRVWSLAPYKYIIIIIIVNM